MYTYSFIYIYIFIDLFFCTYIFVVFRDIHMICLVFIDALIILHFMSCIYRQTNYITFYVLYL